MAKEADNAVGKCPKCGAPLFEKSKKVINMYGIVNGETTVVDIKEVYHCSKCGAEPRTQELR